MTRHVLKMVWNRKRASALLVAEMFLSFLVLFVVLTVVAALLVAVRQPLGYQWRDVWTVGVEGAEPIAGGEIAPAGAREAIDMIMRELASMPQIAAVAASDTPPYARASNEGEWTIDGKIIHLTRDHVTDGFAEVMRLKIVRGRWFNRADDAAGFTPVVIDADLAADLYGTADPIGKVFDEDQRVQRVVGVVAPYRKTGEFANFGKPVNMVFFRTSPVVAEQLPGNILIRVRPGTPASFEQAMVERLQQLAPNTNFNVRRMSGMRDFAIRAAALPIAALVIVAGFLLTMVVLGLSGVLWQNVTRRTREIGLRRAIGATGPAVQRQIVMEVGVLTTLAVVLGLAVVTQLPILGIFTIIEPSAYVAGIVASLAAIYALTITCGLYPGWLASRVQPAQALHYE
jgi:putative ABC transport system permease protein